MQKLKLSKSPKISPEELLASLQQEETQRYAEEQERLRAKAALECKEYNQRQMLLLETAKFFRKLEKIASDHRRQLDIRRDWVDYLSCRKSPSPNSAPELREALFRWVYQQEEASSKILVGWTQSDNEGYPFSKGTGPQRSLKNKMNEIYRNLGEMYITPVREALDVLESLENGLRPLQQDETSSVRDEIRKFISDSVDRMTFRIGSNLVRHMESLDPLMSEFNFHKADALALYLWSFRQIPLPPNYNLLMKAIDMKPLGLTIHRPPSLDLKDFLLRGLWLEFDHFSNQDPTQAVDPPDPYPELISLQETEWSDRQEFRRKRLATLRKRREDYEVQERCRRAEAEALSSKTPKESSGKGKDVKSKAIANKGKKKDTQELEIATEPPVVTDETEIDIDAEFELEEADRFWASLSCVSPSALPLEEDYVNLREYCITGGVYRLARFDKLPQPIDLRPDFMYCNVPAGLKLSEKRFQVVDEEELIKIDLRLPLHCCWWEQPTVCCWEAWEESEQFTQLPSEVQQFQLQHAEIEAHKATLLFAAPETHSDQLGVPKNIQDFDLRNIPNEVRLHFLIRQHILPRLPEGYRFRAELKRLYLVLKERAERRLARGREQAVCDQILLKYALFLEASLHDKGLSEMRHPDLIDIGEEDETQKTGGKRNIHADNNGSSDENDKTLQQFPLVHPDVPRYLYPPTLLCRPLSFTTESDRSGTSFDELGPKMENLLLVLESRNAMLDDDADERFCELFSTFLKLLEYLRKKEKPNFPPLPPPSPTEEKCTENVQIVVKELKQRHIDIRTTKKHPLGLGSRTRSLSRASESSPVSGEKKKRKRKSTPVREKLLLQSQSFEQPQETSESPTEVFSLIEHAPGRWSTKPIRRQTYDAKQGMLTFWTDRLGTFGLAARRYLHLPFLHWEMRRHGRVANLTTVITLSASKMDINFHITSQGFRVLVHDRRWEAEENKKGEKEDQRIAPEIGWFSLEDLGKYLLKINVHVFPEVDTCFYTSTVAPKHEAMELHNLRCLGAFCLTHNLQRCVWNEYANRRTGLLLCRQLIEGRHELEFETIMITPLKSQLVEVEELCSNSLEEVFLAFHPRPTDQSYNADCYGLLKERMEEPTRKVLAKTPPLLQWNVSQLLMKLRLLSYS